jgi:ATP-binding cassette subfamily B protein
LPIHQTVGLGDVTRIDDRSGIEEAVARAGLDQLVTKLPGGLDTRLGKMFTDGVDVSVGQWQRLAIARALFRDAPVVVLDEPSASLDPRGEAELFDLLHELGRGRMVIYVSHRFATVRSADVVMVMDQGEVVEMGSHDELMSRGGLYHDLFTLQAERYGLTDRAPESR